jgi:hypothetical protein
MLPIYCLVRSKGHRCTGMNCSFVYSAVCPFDTTNTWQNSNVVGGALQGLNSELAFSTCGGCRFDALGVPLFFWGRGPV